MTHVIPFERVKRINQKSRDIVFGYIRKYQSLLPLNQTYYQIHESIKYIILLFYYQQIESKILTNIENDTLLTLFEQQHKFKELGNYSFKLFYSATKDGFDVQCFNKKCHNTSNLLCIFHTTNNVVFGGYTSKGWSVNPDSFATPEHDDKAFIFHVRSDNNYDIRIFNVVESKHALRTQNGFFCMFGFDCTFYLGRSGRSGQACARGFTKNYEKYPNKQYLVGGSQNNVVDFDIENYEIFRLV